MKAYRKTLSVLLKESRGAFLTVAERKRNGYAPAEKIRLDRHLRS